MRPRELTMRGFRSYADETRFWFPGRGLVGIVGPNGSGKSSILDAISFALYGKTPKIERDTKSLISQRRDTLQVELVFEVDGTVWRAGRALRRNGAPRQHLMARRASAEADRRELETRSVALAAADERARTLGALRESVLQADEVLREAEARGKAGTRGDA